MLSLFFKSATFIAKFAPSLNKPALLRLQGSRIEVIVVLLRNPKNPMVLLGHSIYDRWMFPQEGVNIGESFEVAALRCLKTECSIDTDRLVIDNGLYIRSVRYVGRIDLDKGRVGERPVADNANNHFLGGLTLKSKSYWLATILIQDNRAMSLKPNGLEFDEVQWQSCEEAESKIRESNKNNKANLLVDCLRMVQTDLLAK